MRITVNLATRPYVELRPFFLRLRILMAVLAVVAVGALIATHLLQKKLDVAKEQLDQVHVKVLAARQEKLSNEHRMRQPANAEVLARAHFLNTLFLTKSFSWTAVMMDLERVLPIGVQVTSIEPQISTDGSVLIKLRVSGERDRAVQLVRNLERSRRFRSPRLTGEAAQAREAGTQGNFSAANPNSLAPPGVEFEILADYNPLPEGELYSSEKSAKSQTSANKSKSPSSKSRSSKPRSSKNSVLRKPDPGTRLTPANGGAR